MEELLNNKTFAVHAAAAATSVAIGTAVTYPLDTLKVLMQVSNIDGIVLSAHPSREDEHLLLSEALLARFASGTVESLISSPFEMIKVRAQVASASGLTPRPSIVEKSAVPPLVSRLLPRYSLDMNAMSKSMGLLSTLTNRNGNILDSLKEYPWMMTGSGKPLPVSNVRTLSEIVSLEGWTALWRGYRSGIVRDSIFGGLFFGSWQFLHQVMINWKAVNMDPMPRYDSEVGPLLQDYTLE
ncbi:uncharacterized protein LOC121797195 [Salvia splendens]|uniref:uncharacterized protein LOC121797195 n=1 Tax=Salvia splendens TaxID=180675 RepID=UPI001C26DCE6|nr:uncharacterized protein LOC121797195 [Salvia splendens]